MRSVVEEMVLGPVFLRILRFSSVSMIPPLFLIFFIDYFCFLQFISLHRCSILVLIIKWLLLCKTQTAVGRETLKAMHFSNIAECWIKKGFTLVFVFKSLILSILNYDYSKREFLDHILFQKYGSFIARNTCICRQIALLLPRLGEMT